MQQEKFWFGFMTVTKIKQNKTKKTGGAKEFPLIPLIHLSVEHFTVQTAKLQHSPVSLVVSPRLGGAGGGPRRSVA